MPYKEDTESQPLIPLPSAGPDEETAMFALGCFWSPDARFGSMPAISRTAVGYAGGSSPEPRYTALDDHIEALQVHFDPRQTSYADLLEIFFTVHNPVRVPIKRQYASALFPVNAEQETRAREALAHHGQRMGGKPSTLILPEVRFHPAEAYHQKFHLQQHRTLFETLLAHFDDDADALYSTEAARMNGWVSGFGTGTEIQDEMERLSFPLPLREDVMKVLSPRQQQSEAV